MSSATKFLLILVLLAVSGFVYVKHAKDKEAARLERERIVAEERIAALRKEEELARLQAEKEKRAEELRVEQLQRQEMALARQEASQVTRSQTYAMQQIEAQRRLDRDRMLLRQLESENSRYRRFPVN